MNFSQELFKGFKIYLYFEAQLIDLIVTQRKSV